MKSKLIRKEWKVCKVGTKYDVFTKDLKTLIALNIVQRSIADHIVETHNTEIAHLIDRPNLHGKNWCYVIFNNKTIDRKYIPIIINRR